MLRALTASVGQLQFDPLFPQVAWWARGGVSAQMPSTALQAAVWRRPLSEAGALAGAAEIRAAPLNQMCAWFRRVWRSPPGAPKRRCFGPVPPPSTVLSAGRRLVRKTEDRHPPPGCRVRFQGSWHHPCLPAVAAGKPSAWVVCRPPQYHLREAVGGWVQILVWGPMASRSVAGK